ncbi:putative flocculation protein FLO11 isoform X2 [Penaeus vannamei]|uniref:receptor protein-tyrosine kinase n=1 Tax=Penaeus vannamei TaxID=6689 RepID=A0A3R7QCS6_PENVA|nr:putative flocculation protein FLO11 isoform X2 [Penaeus vannamei]
MRNSSLRKSAIGLFSTREKVPVGKAKNGRLGACDALRTCDGRRGGRSPGVRRGSGVAAARYVTSNGLSEAEQAPSLDYVTLLEEMSGDFGVRSDVVEAATREPEYHGAETLVVPLYIPEGAVPINLARIARSGSPDSVVELVDMKVSPSADSVLIRRLGPASGPRTRPRRPPQRTRVSRLPSIRRSDLTSQRPVTLPTAVPGPLLARFGQRLTSPKAAPLIAVRRTPLTQGVSDRTAEDSEEEEENKRAKKNELSKDSQFHHHPPSGAAENTSSSASPTEPPITTLRPASPATSSYTTEPATPSTETADVAITPGTSARSPTTTTTQATPSSTEENSSPWDRSALFPSRPVETGHFRFRPRFNRQKATITTTSATSTDSNTTSTSTTPSTTSVTPTHKTSLPDRITTRRPPLLLATKRPTTTTTVSTTTDSTTSTTLTAPAETTRRIPFVIRKPGDALTPVRKMPSVKEVLGSTEDQEQHEEKAADIRENSTNAHVPNLEVTTKDNISIEEAVSQTHISEEEDLMSEKEDVETELESEPPVTPSRKDLRWSRPLPQNPNSKVRGEGRPNGPPRRRRPRPRTTSLPPVTRASDYFKVPAEFVAVSTATEATGMPSSNASLTPNYNASTSHPIAAGATEKSPEEVVIESLTEIMKEATTNNKSKDKFSTIAGNLEALNKQLAEQGIHIIHAEIDGVRIKLDNRTLVRPTTSYPEPTTFRPSTEFKVSSLSDFLSTTEDPSTNLFSPPVENPDTDESEEDIEKQIYTSVKSSFSIHTSKPTDVEDETDSANEVQSTTNDSSFTTLKPTELKKFSDKPLRGDSFGPALSTSFVPEEVLKDNRTRQEETPFVAETVPVQTSTSSDVREKDGEGHTPLSSFVISATSTVPASVTTRTRSTTVPVTTHIPIFRSSSFNPKVTTSAVYPIDEASVSEITDEEHVTDAQDLAPNLHPTSHHRPVSLPTQPELSTEHEVPMTPRDPSIAIVIEEKVNRSTTSFVFRGRSTTRRPIIETISNTRGVQEPPAPGSVTVVKDTASEEFSETTSSASSSSTAVYIIGVLGLIPAAGLAFFLAKKFLRKTQKALPESEERAEGFTPITHHTRKPSHSNTLDIEPSSVEAKNPKFTPWEFPRSKLRLVSVLGEGNFGVVWKAEARDLCACEGATGGPTVLVAVKGVKEGAGQKEKQDLLKELAIMQHIGQHPNVVTLLGCCTQQEPFYVIMEYVMFGKLLAFLRDHRTRHNYYNFSSDTEALTSRDLTRFACQIATGCDYLQSRGIIHRDLASRNILVDHNKVCKIADFGLARSVKDLGSDIYEQKSRGALPIRWMAPESLYMNIFTHKSDVWSFGILCWEIVTLGSTPYPGMTAREVMRRVREGYRLDRPEHCRPELYHIVTKCWHQDLNKRPTFSELKVELANLLDSQPGYIIDLENFPEGSYYSMHENNEEKL